MVRATFGSFSGPMTMSATAPTTMSSVKLKSNMPSYRKQQSGAGFVFFVSLDIDRVVLDTLGLDLAGRVFLAVLHALLEAAHCAAEVLAHVTQLLGTEDERHDDQNDKPVPNTERTHELLRDVRCAAWRRRTSILTKERKSAVAGTAA